MASTVCPVKVGDVAQGKRVGPLCGLYAIVCFGLLYGLVHSGLRLASSDDLSGASALANILAQTLALGYEERQPPLYEWLLWLLQRVTGPNLLSFLLINYALLTATLVFLYLSAQRLFDDWRWAVVAGLSPLLLYQFGWNLHEGVTHSLAMSCAIAASLWAFMRMAESGRLGDYLLFGIAAGFGLITKYGFVAYLIILLVCALLQPALRNRLFDVRILASLGIASAIAAPFGWWLITNNHDLVGVFSSTVAPNASDRLTATMTGIISAIYAPIGFLFPLIIVLPVVFPSLWRGGWTRFKDNLRLRSCAGTRPDWPLLLLHMTLFGFLFLVTGAVLTGASNFLERYMHPFFLLTPLWMVWFAVRNDPAAQPKSMGIALLVVTLAVLPIRVVNLTWWSLGPDCGACRLAVPYEGLAARLKAQGFGSGTLIAVDRNDGGNLRRLFPEARIVLLRRPYYAPPVRPQDLSAPAVVVWRPKYEDRVRFLAEPAIWETGGTTLGETEEVTVPWRPLGSQSKPRDWTWMTAPVTPSARPQR